MMKRFTLICIIFISGFLHSCFPGCGISPAEHTAVEFLFRIKDRKIGEAQAFCTPNGYNGVMYCIHNYIDIKLVDVMDVKCRIQNDTAICTFCCTSDSASGSIKLKKPDDKWLVDDIGDLIQDR